MFHDLTHFLSEIVKTYNGNELYFKVDYLINITFLYDNDRYY